MLYAYAIRYASRCFAPHYHIISYHAHTPLVLEWRCYGSKTCTGCNKLVHGASMLTYTHTPTEKANPFSTILNRLGGWVFSKSFPLGGYGSKICI